MWFTMGIRWVTPQRPTSTHEERAVPASGRALRKQCASIPLSGILRRAGSACPAQIKSGAPEGRGPLGRGTGGMWFTMGIRWVTPQRPTSTHEERAVPASGRALRKQCASIPLSGILRRAGSACPAQIKSGAPEGRGPLGRGTGGMWFTMGTRWVTPQRPTSTHEERAAPARLGRPRKKPQNRTAGFG